MSGLRDWLERLRRNETLNRITGGRPDIAIYGAPLLAISAIVAVVVLVIALAGGGGEGDDEQASGKTPTVAAEGSPTPTAGPNAGQLTPIAFGPEDYLTDADLAARGAGEPGRGEFIGDRLIIPRLEVDAPFTVRQVGTDGRMPNPQGPEDIAWYDFSQWPGLGGAPTLGGNIVLAGHVDYINYGPAVLWDMHTLEPGDLVQIRTTDGRTLEYRIEFNKTVPSSGANWEHIVAATKDESVTLITCVGDFVAGHYTNRQIAWGRRVS
jgi:LPXTG-site transpeptidase (sortase) family protein